MADFRFKEFCNLDDSPNADYLIQSMDTMLSLDSVRRIKRESIDLLALKQGDIVLEAGCGFANDVEILADAVGMNGKVIGIDTSQHMLAKAKERTKKNKNIEYQLMDVENIQYPANSFSAVHADRLMVSHENYEKIFKEILRVVKPGGAISLTDVDAQTIAIMPHTSITNIVFGELLAGFVNPDMGRKLLNLFSNYHLKNVQIRPNLSTINNFHFLKKILDFDMILNTCIESGKLTKDKVCNWLNEMQASSDKGHFLYCITFFTVLGRKSYQTE